MSHHDTPQAPKSDDSGTVSRRRFLQGGLAAAAAATAASSIALPLSSSAATTAQPDPREVPPAPPNGKRPNFLIILCDEMRFPPSYESQATKDFREAHLEFQNTLLANGLDFQRQHLGAAQTALREGQRPRLAARHVTKRPGRARRRERIRAGDQARHAHRRQP